MRGLKDWEEVEGVLEEIGLLDLAVSELSSALGRKLYELLGEYSPRISELSARRGGLESTVQQFCLSHKSDFAKKRSRQLRYGRIAFRLAERIDIPDEFQQSAIATLKKLGLTDCIETRERLDRSALKKLSDADLARCGIKRTREDHFRVEPDLKLISEKAGRRECSVPSFSVDLEKLAKLVAEKKSAEGKPFNPTAE